jgi:hypothetical protein
MGIIIQQSTLCRQIAQLYYVVTGGIYSNYLALKGSLNTGLIATDILTFWDTKLSLHLLTEFFL